MCIEAAADLMRINILALLMTAFEKREPRFLGMILLETLLMIKVSVSGRLMPIISLNSLSLMLSSWIISCPLADMVKWVKKSSIRKPRFWIRLESEVSSINDSILSSQM